MSGGLRTSVKGSLIAQRLAVASYTLLENETMNNTVTAPLDPPPHPVEETTMDSTTNGHSICSDGKIPCFPILTPATKNMDSYWTRTRAESPPPQGVNLNSNIPSVLVPSSPQTEGEILQSFNLKSFYYNELRTATRNFRPDSILGEGGFGSVFKGWIDEHSLTPAKCGTGMVIMVKMLRDQWQSHKEWLNEVNCLGQLSHPNLVKLIGYCLEDGHRALVYEYMEKGSLENHLFTRTFHASNLSWNLRIKIALDAAKALAFLHSDEAKCIYVDFDTSKILLGGEYNVKLWRYGLAQQVPEGYRTRLLDKALCYYAAPEYISGGEDQLTPRSDVYSFGVVLLELVSGRRAIDMNRPMAEHDLVQLAKVSKKRTVHQIIDARMGGQYSESEAFKVVKLAIQCLSKESRLRPDMHQVMEILENLQSSK